MIQKRLVRSFVVKVSGNVWTQFGPFYRTRERFGVNRDRSDENGQN